MSLMEDFLTISRYLYIGRKKMTAASGEGDSCQVYRHMNRFVMFGDKLAHKN